ncbi:MAG: hypothetical protein LBD07_03920 [Spirochaetaceae bacterium]|jgi:hypothetical protein|nr:hypothetical protein [Spirochaetaceae bacterium]
MHKTAFLFCALAAGAALYAQGPDFSGLLDSKLTLNAGAGEAQAFSFGLEEYANLRLQSKLGERAVFYGAFNLIAVTGSAAQAASGLGGAFVFGENYAASMEIERLYARFSGSFADVDAGLMRLGFGFGQIFAPSDFMNGRNPLFPDARPRAVLGTAASFYPNDDSKISAFATGPRNPLNADGGGVLAGASAETHWEKASVQLLYAFETPEKGSGLGVHRTGLSVKADVEIGLWLDALYSYNHEERTDIGGLSASAGADYSFAGGDCYVLAEYLWSGEESVSSNKTAPASGFANRNYLYAMFRYAFNDYTALSLACLAGIDDASFSPAVNFDYDVFQGFTLSVNARVPLDRSVFDADGARGEFGPLPPGANAGSRLLVTVKGRLKI